MKRNKTSLLLYYDIKEKTAFLSDAQFGQLIRAFIDYDQNGIEPTFEDILQCTFQIFKPVLDQNKQDYFEKCKKLSENIQGYWNKNKSIQMNTNEYKRKQKYSNATDTDTDTDTKDSIEVDTKFTSLYKEKGKEIYKEKGKEKSVSETAKRFLPPTVDEVSDYCLERKNSIDAQRFIDYYTSNGWKVGKNTMKDWKAAVRTWERTKESPTQDTSRKIGNNIWQI